MGTVGSISSKVIGKVTNLKPVRKCCEYFKKEPEKAIAYSTIASVVGKDGIGCYMYVKQSLNNEKIPDDKRKFVAALDLTNGVLMIASQLALFFAMRKFNEPLFNKLFKKSFDKEGQVFKTIASAIRKTQKDSGLSISRKLSIKKEYDEIRKGCLDTFKFVTELAAATILAKRVIVPFIATPLAEKVKNKMEAKTGTTQPAATQNNDKNTTEQTAATEKKQEYKEPVKQDNNIDFKSSNEQSNLLAKIKNK